MAGSPRELAAEVDILCSCRVTPTQSVEAFLGPEGAMASGRHGLLCHDLATIDPGTDRRIAAELAQAGIGFLDAPVSGGPSGAAAATLSIMAGGTEADFARAEPLLECMGKALYHMGPAGAGVSTKLCNNLITGTLHVLICEAMVFGVKSGIAPERLYEVLRNSTARSTTLERLVPNHVLPRNFEPGSALDMIVKDLDCATGAARELGMELRLPALARDCFAEASAQGLGARDLSAVLLAIEKAAGLPGEPRN
jgi:3-hydroxyisobutyrate dehydrogenase-like beta-hydroxyacid dehydrogenase